MGRGFDFDFDFGSPTIVGRVPRSPTVRLILILFSAIVCGCGGSG